MVSVLGWFANPIHRDGDYPEVMRKQLFSILPRFSEAEKNEVRGTADFFAFSFGPNNFKPHNTMAKLGQNVSLNLRDVLNWIKLEYGNPRILITENGWFTDSHVKTEDTTAIYMMKNFLNQVLQGWSYISSILKTVSNTFAIGYLRSPLNRFLVLLDFSIVQ